MEHMEDIYIYVYTYSCCYFKKKKSLKTYFVSQFMAHTPTGK